MNAPIKNPSKPSKDQAPCVCFAHDDGTRYEEVTDLPNGEVEYTPTEAPVFRACGATTKRIYAPGHDAKLKGALIRTYVADLPYIYQDGGMLTHGDPYQVAKSLGWAHFLDSAKLKADVKAAAKAHRKERAAEAKADKPPTTVKIGRWNYDIVVLDKVGSAESTVHYTTKSGEVKVATVPNSKIS